MLDLLETAGPGQGEVGESGYVGPGELVIETAPLGADKSADLIALDRVDVAAEGVGDLPHALGDGGVHAFEVECRTELEPGLRPASRAPGWWRSGCSSRTAFSKAPATIWPTLRMKSR